MTSSIFLTFIKYKLTALRNTREIPFKGNVSVILNDPTCKDSNARFTTALLIP